MIDSEHNTMNSMTVFVSDSLESQERYEALQNCYQPAMKVLDELFVGIPPMFHSKTPNEVEERPSIDPKSPGIFSTFL